MSVRLSMKTTSEEILNALEALDKELNPIRQQETMELICNNIKNNVAKTDNMSLLQEEVLEDGSIVLTISV